MTPRLLLRTALAIALLETALLASACFGGGDDGDTSTTPSVTPSPTTSPSATASPSPTATLPPLELETVEARVITNDLNVRTGPHVIYPVVGRLNDGDLIEVAGWREDNEGQRWYGIPHVGWVADNSEWLDFDRLAVDRALDRPDEQFAMLGPTHSPGVRTGNERVDEVIATVVSGDLDAIEDLITFTAFPCGNDSGVGGPPQCEPGAEDGTPTLVFSVARCHGEYEPDRGDIPALVREWSTPFQSALGTQSLRVFAVLESPLTGASDPFYGLVVIFAFSSGEGRAAFVGPNGGIVALASGCGPVSAGDVDSLALLGQKPIEEVFFLLRPVVPSPLEAPRVATWPPGTRTGDPLVDRVLDALDDGSREALAAVLHPVPIACVTIHADLGGPPGCIAGEEPGTQIPVMIVSFGCEAENVREPYALDALELFVSEELALYAVLLVDEPPAKIWGPDRTFMVFEVLDRRFSTRYLVLDEAGVHGVARSSCSLPAPSFVSWITADSHFEYVLAPR